MNKPERKKQTNLPHVRIRAVESPMGCAMGAIEDGSAITAEAARRTLEKPKERRCMG